MQMITITQMEQIMEHVVLGQREPVMFVGQFGVGKTAGVEGFARRTGAYLHKVLLGQYDTVDLRGTPWIADLSLEYRATVWHPASTLPFKGNPNFPTDTAIYLFLDELTSATVPVLGLCYQLVNEHRIGEHELMDNVHIVCAGNREQDRGIVTRMPMPLCNRMTWYEIGVDVDQWSMWAQETYGEDAAMFVAFLQFRRNLICTYDPAKPEKNVATPRTWEKCIKYFRATMPLDIKMASMAGAVGDGQSHEFWGFMNSWKKITDFMPKIMKEPTKTPVPEEASLQYALTVAISGAMNEKTTPILHQYLVRMPPEFAILAWHLAVKRDPALFSTDQFIDFTKRYKVVFN